MSEGRGSWNCGGFSLPHVILERRPDGSWADAPADLTGKVIRWTAEDEANLARRVKAMAPKAPK